jgi:hypothetical protein
MRKFYFSLLTLLVSLSCLAQYATTEGEFMTPVFLNKASLNAQQKQMADKIQTLPYQKGIQYVQINSLAKVQKKGVLTFTIPGQKNPLSFQVSHVEAQDPQNYTWYGQLLNGVGSAVLISENGTVYGSFQVENQTYRLYGIDKNTSALITIDNKAFDKGVCPNPLASETSLTDPEPPTHSSGRVVECYNPTRILFLVTGNARQADPNINQSAATGVAQFNNALQTSRVYGANLQMAGVVDFAFSERFADGNRMDIEINRVVNSSIAQQLRIQYKADVVMILTGNGYVTTDIFGQVTGRVYGVAAEIDAKQQNAFCLVEAGSIGNNYVFSHEIGHLYGGGHENDFSSPNLKSYSHGYYFRRTRFLGIFKYRYATLMHTLDYLQYAGMPSVDQVSRPSNFSNPNIEVDGCATGDNDVHNVARRMNENAARFANFQPSTGVLHADVLGRGLADREGSYSYEASVTCGQAPYSYQWATSYDGLTYSDAGGETQDTYSFYVYPGDVFDYYLRVTITDATGQATTAFQKVMVNTSPFSGRKAAETVATNVKGSPELKDVFPNPTATDAHISFILPVSTDLVLSLYNSVGQHVQTIVKGTYESGYHTEILSTTHLPNGVYFYRLTTNSSTQTKRLVILR